MLHAPADALVYETGKEKLEIWLPAPGIVIQRAAGHATVEMSRVIRRKLDAVLATGVRLLIFDDWEALDGYTSEARIDLTKWTADNAPRIERAHVLLRSKLVAMGLAVSNLVTGGIVTAYTDRREFERVLAASVRAATPGRTHFPPT